MSTRKRITELSVAELRSQLVKRGVDAAGDRASLVAKLKKALQDEGVKPSQARKAAAAAAAAAVAGDVSGAQSTAERQPVMAKDEKSSASATDGPAQSDRDASLMDVSMKVDSDAGTSLTEESSLVIRTPDTSTIDGLSTQMSPQKDAAPVSISADEASNATELPVPAASENAGLPSRGTVLNTSAEKTKNENTADSLDKNITPQDKSGIDTTSINKTVTMEGANTGGDNSLWVSGLTSAFRAADLKQLFGKYGKVVTAKVVTSAKSPGSKCFGFIVLASAEEAQQAINNLNNTLVNGQTITVEKDRQKRAILQPQAMTRPVLATTTLWINGLSTDTKAADLKTLFIKYGKVTGAKVVTSAKNPGTKCFGLVTLSTAAEAELCIERLNKTEFHGRIISLEKAKSDVKTQAKSNMSAGGKAAAVTDGSTAKKDEVKTAAASKAGTEKDVTESGADKQSEADRAKDLKKDKNILSLDKIKEERERERRMLRERAAREQERRQLRELDRERREEADRVTRERERLRMEKLRLERERMRAERARMELERERHRQERELEQERERLERQQRLQTTSFRSELKRPVTSNSDAYWSAAKRQVMEAREPVSSFNYGSSGGYYEKSGAGERRDTQMRSSRELDKGGSAAASMWASRPAEHRNTGSALTSYGGQSYGGPSDWKTIRTHSSGVTVGDWQSGGSAYRGTTGNYAGVDSGRQHGSSASASANYPYFNMPTSQSYNKWY